MRTPLVALAALAILSAACRMPQDRPAPAAGGPEAAAQGERLAVAPPKEAAEPASIPVPSEPPAPEPTPASAGSQREPLRVGGEVTRPVLISKGPIDYDALNRRKDRKAGVVIVEAVIDEKGGVRDLRLLKGLDREIDAAVLASLRAAKFKPATLAGQPVPVYFTLTTNIEVQ